jgi:hypothetical protein
MEIAFVGNNYSGDLSTTGNLSGALRVVGAQFGNALDGTGNDLADTLEWVAFDPSSVGLDRARGSLAIEVDVNPPVVWLKQSPAGGLPTGWVALTTSAGGPAAQLAWPAIMLTAAPIGTPVTVKALSPPATVQKADATGGLQVLGVLAAASAGADSAVTVIQGGLITLTTGEWDALVTGESGGLEPVPY